MVAFVEGWGTAPGPSGTSSLTDVAALAKRVQESDMLRRVALMAWDQAPGLLAAPAAHSSRHGRRRSGGRTIHPFCNAPSLHRRPITYGAISGGLDPNAEGRATRSGTRRPQRVGGYGSQVQGCQLAGLKIVSGGPLQALAWSRSRLPRSRTRTSPSPTRAPIARIHHDLTPI